MMEGKDCDRLLDGVFGLGINAFDTARVYGLAEKSLGNWMEHRKNREQIMVLSKGGHPATGTCLAVKYKGECIPGGDHHEGGTNAGKRGCSGNPIDR